MLDLLLRGGTVIDGSGNPAYGANVGVDDGKIVLLRAGADEARRVIDVAGLLVVPGFIDAHSHSDFVFFRDPRPDMKLRQGVTTEIVGNCGSSPSPLTGGNRAFMEPHVEDGIRALGKYRSLGEYLDKVQEHGLINSQAFLVGHKPIRTAILGMENRAPLPHELEEMESLLAEAMDQGAFGLSSGLLYPPMCFAHLDELVALCRVVAERGGVFTCHMRNYSSEIVDSVQEVLQIARDSGVPAQISHFMLAGRTNWGKASEVLAMIDEAREDGVDVTFDQYPYPAANPNAVSLLPPWMHEGGLDKTLERLKDARLRKKAAHEMQEGIPGWESISQEAGWERLVLLSEVLDAISGKALQEVAEIRGQEPTDAVFDILVDDPHARLIAHWVSEYDLRELMQHHCQMVSSDSSIPGPLAHPRSYGTFPRVLGEYVRKAKVLSWEEAIRKMTWATARRFGIRDRGLILDGWQADLVVLNPETVTALATFEEPDRYPAGIDYVIVNGQIAVDQGEHTGRLSGEAVRRAQ
jgi:N-acyl-D-aspartate/D-glutamate deacylase